MYLFNKNKQTQLWHQHLALVTNTQVVRICKLVNSINICLKKYNLIKVFIDSNNSEISFNKNELPTNIGLQLIKTTIYDIDSAHQIRDNNIGIAKLFIFCVSSKLTQVVRRNKIIIPIINKLKKIRTDLCNSYYLLFHFGGVYTRISPCRHICKTWTFYLQEKNNFGDCVWILYEDSLSRQLWWVYIN